MAYIDSTIPQKILEQLVIISSLSSHYEAEKGVYLHLYIPGHTSTEMEERSRQLADTLRICLTAIDAEWVHSVELKSYPEGHQIDVLINDPSLMRRESERLILDAARVALAPFARRSGRKLVALSHLQTLVPLDFQGNEPGSTKLSVTLPKNVYLATSSRFYADCHDTMAHAAVRLLERNLQAKLEVSLYSVFYADVRIGTDGYAVTLTRRENAPLRWYEINGLQRLVAELVAEHMQLKSGGMIEPVVVPLRDLELPVDE